MRILMTTTTRSAIDEENRGDGDCLWTRFSVIWMHLPRVMRIVAWRIFLWRKGVGYGYGDQKGKEIVLVYFGVFVEFDFT
ncbi:hypothetical protein JTE90_018975 [Oedothorax gibbosus]|uniref:Transmembrane protein n=1 Tax=Oedothorax gibbosus TaxID=931172 RepID=A0AAV6UZ56_9ARAC|nr:hypothetical protein JTE90_018975 [Oedothorax gibbosus]